VRLFGRRNFESAGGLDGMGSTGWHADGGRPAGLQRT